MQHQDNGVDLLNYDCPLEGKLLQVWFECEVIVLGLHICWKDLSASSDVDNTPWSIRIKSTVLTHPSLGAVSDESFGR